MLLEQSALCNKAAELELKAIEECKFHPYFMTELDTFFLDVYSNLRPTASDYQQRRQLVQEFNMIVKSSFGNIEGFPVVEAFGSFIMDIFTANSDLDLSINFNNSNALNFPRNRAVHVLRSLTKDLYRKQRKGQLSGVLPILRARVPVLKAVDCKTGIECDISVENKDGISRSLFFSIISSIDERFHILSYLMKAWAKANDINSSKDSTMNSLSIIALVAFHFQVQIIGLTEQTRNPPILPPFSAYLRDGSDITNLKKVVLEFKNFGCKNKESVAELFVALLIKLSSVGKLWELGLCASTFGGSWVLCTSKVGNMNVEDFFNRSENFARSVGKCQLTKIYDCIHESLKNLSRTMLGLIKFYNLRSVLFGSTSFDTRNDHVKGKSSTTIKKKPTGKIQHKQKACNQTATTTNQIGGNTCLDKKQRLSLNKPSDPKNPIQKEKSGSKTVTPTNRANNNKALVLKRKVSSNEPAEPHTQKARRVAPALPSIHLPAPITYPVVPPIPFVLPGHPFHGDPMQPVFANMVYGYQPQHHMIYHPMAHPYAPNPTTHPSLILGCPTYVAGHPHIPFPPFSSFGSNRL